MVRQLRASLEVATEVAPEMAAGMAPRHTDAADAALLPALLPALRPALRPAHAPRRSGLAGVGDAAGDTISYLLRRCREGCSREGRQRLCSAQADLSKI